MCRDEVLVEVEVVVVEVAAEVDPRTKCHNLMHTLYDVHLDHCIRSFSVLALERARFEAYANVSYCHTVFIYSLCPDF